MRIRFWTGWCENDTQTKNIELVGIDYNLIDSPLFRLSTRNAQYKFLNLKSEIHNTKCEDLRSHISYSSSYILHSEFRNPKCGDYHCPLPFFSAFICGNQRPNLVRVPWPARLNEFVHLTQGELRGCIFYSSIFLLLFRLISL